VTDGALARVTEKVLAGERLDASDGLILYATSDLTGLGALAHHARTARHGRTAYFVRNQHVNYTNVCNKGCRFCSFYAKAGPASSPDRPGAAAYVLTPDQVQAALVRYADAPITEVHMVGGIHPGLPYAYYLDILSAVRASRPDVHIKAFTAVELRQISEVAGKPLSVVLAELRHAGLSSIPGGGAEVLCDRVHDALYPAKLTPDEWIETSRAIGQAGLPQYATMLHGHIETADERIEHLERLRDLQDETGHFLAFTPLSFRPEGTDLANLPGPTALDDLRAIAVARLMLDNIPHIKTFWVMITEPVAQIGLLYGADDMDGTVEEYRITYAEGRPGDVRQALRPEAMVRLIAEAGLVAVERDGTYGAVRT
jgi:aminodeoxyfutalosine synthase